jgi:hypothetical protein
MEKVIGIVISLMFFGVVARINIPLAAQSASEQRSPTPNPPKFTLKTSVNRVLLDVVVTAPQRNDPAITAASMRPDSVSTSSVTTNKA